MNARPLLTLSLALGACAPAAMPSSRPATAAPPPLTPTLSLAQPPEPGGSLDVAIAGMAPGAAWALYVANGGVAVDQGACPPQLGGECLDVLPGHLGYHVLDHGTASPAGDALSSIPIPATARLGAYQLGAVVTSPAVVEAAPVAFTLALVCPTLAEPNDDSTQAAPLSADLAGLAVCPGDLDWFQIEVPPATTVAVGAAPQPGDGDLDLELWSEAGVLLDGSYRLNTDEEVLWQNASNQPVTVRALAWAVTDPQRDGIRYDLSLDMLQQAPCVDDAYEDDDLPPDAAAIQPGAWTGHQACAGDRDWFVIDVQANTQLRVRAVVPPGEGDVGVELYDTRGIPLTAGAVDSATWLATAPTRVLIATDLIADDLIGGGASYTLDVRTSAITVCGADALEPNDAPGQAATVAAGSYTALQQCAQDSDWYSLAMTAGQRASVSLWFSIQDGDIDAEVRGPNGQVVGGGIDGSSNELFSFTASTTGTYQIRTYLFSDTGPPITGGALYDMDIAVQ